MRSEAELDRADYHLRLMIEQMQRDGSSEAAIEKTIRIASGCRPRAKLSGHTTSVRETATQRHPGHER